MAYVKRNQAGEIIAVYETAENGATEYLTITSSELIKYLATSSKDTELTTALSVSDTALIRVLEDLIDTLVENNIIVFTDLPVAAREKLMHRDQIRGRLNSLTNLISGAASVL